MKKYKKIISAVMALAVSVMPLPDGFSAVMSNPVVSHAESVEGVTDDGFGYTTFLWQIHITSYEGTNPDVVIPETINGSPVCEIYDGIFADNQTIKSVDFSNSKYPYSIGAGIFENSSVESVILPKNISCIPNNTFKNCKNLKNVDFGDNILVIPESAFEGSSYVLPDEMASKVKNACYENSTSGYVITDEWQYSLDYGNQARLKKYLGNDTDIVIPETIDGIPVVDINNDIFDGVVNSVVIPSKINDFNALIDLKYPEELRRIEFKSRTLEIYDGIQKYNIEEITMPIPVDYDDNHILNSKFFSNCQTIKKVEFAKGKGDLTLEKGAFGNCSALDTVIFNKGYDLITFNNNAFRNSSIRKLEINADCEIKFKAFAGCKNLQEIVFNGNVDALNGAFDDCTINNIIFGDTSITVSSGAFNGHNSLMNINSKPAFDESTGDFNPEYKDFIIRNFSGADDVGFVNEYITWHVKDIVNKYTNDSMSDMEKIKVLHDWVCDNVSYSTKTVSGAEEHNDLSPFLTGVTVCDGYARAFNLLANEAGIETYYICSNNHIWNVVKLGGHYFHVDTTWDDGESSYNWFLKSDDEMRSETSSHSYWELKTPSSLHSFQKDTLPECAYPMGDCNTDGDISVADIVKMERYLLGADAVSPDDFVLYDLDFSGDVDVFDMIEMRGLIAGNSGEIPYGDDINLMTDWLLGKTDSFNPEWDFNGDGVVDVFDLIILRQNLS